MKSLPAIALSLAILFGFLYSPVTAQSNPELAPDSLARYDRTLDSLGNILPADQFDSLGLATRLPAWRNNEALSTYAFTTGTKWMYEVWLVVMCGFCGILLLLLYRSTRENGILYLSLAVLCWFVSGISAYFAIMQHDQVWVKVGNSIFSTCNSAFLLLMISHLDPDDFFQKLIARGARQFITWAGTFIVLLYGWFFKEKFWQGFYIADLVFSVITLGLLAVAFWYIFRKRVSVVVAMLSVLPLAVTGLAEIFRASPWSFSSFQLTVFERAVWGQTLLFLYKPLLIVIFFALVISWLWKKLNALHEKFDAEADKIKEAHASEIASLKALWEKELASVTKAHEAELDALRNPSEMSENRKNKYPKLDELDWKIVERIAKGDNVPSIAAALGMKKDKSNGPVPSRIEKIARELRLPSSAQIHILRYALLNGVLTTGHLTDD